MTGRCILDGAFGMERAQRRRVAVLGVLG